MSEIIQQLAGPLRAEGRAGYRDTTIIGSSIGAYARAWARRAREAGLPEALRARCGEISVLLAEYRELGVAARRQRVERALGLLEGMEKAYRSAQGGRSGGQGAQAASLRHGEGKAGFGDPALQVAGDKLLPNVQSAQAASLRYGEGKAGFGDPALQVAGDKLLPNVQGAQAASLRHGEGKAGFGDPAPQVAGDKLLPNVQRRSSLKPALQGAGDKLLPNVQRRSSLKPVLQGEGDKLLPNVQRRSSLKPALPEVLEQPVPTGRGRSTLAERLRRLGIETNRDLLYYFPREYVALKKVGDLVDGERAAVVVRAMSREQSALKERRGFVLMRFALEVSDGSGRAWVTSVMRVPRMGQRAAALLGSPPALNYAAGTRLLVEGLVKRAGKFIEIQYYDAMKLGPEEGVAGAFTPVYPLTDGIYQSNLRGTVRRVLAQLPEALPDPLPEGMRKRYRLVDLATALREIHWPRTEVAREEAMRRLALEELLTLQLAMAQRKQELQRPGSGISMKPRGDVAAALEEVLPFSLTRAQQRAIAEITGDMAADRPMCRLIQGDVGSGKTVVAAAALMVALQNACQGAVMAPTELLAEQHYLVLSHLLSHFGVTVELLTGSLKAAEREQAYRRIASGRAQVVVGTHALLQEGVNFHQLGLVIVDEQHRFGVRQRASLRRKGQRPDMLVMTATPIPRTLALTVYGDLEVSVLDELPPGRTPVQTRWVPAQRQAEAYEFVRRQIAEGRQAYVVCPLVEESESLQAEAAVKLAEELQQGEFSDLRVGLLHGAMKVAEKDAVMEAFRAGEMEVLVATTVVEVGVDVPNASVMLIQNAERFGLAQLHQLRGRVGRGPFTSYCLLITHQKYDPTGRIKLGGEEESLEDARRRLKVLLEQSDGFAIAEEDLLLRGPGEFYGTRQHGLPDFRLARLVRDGKLVEEAREIARWVTERDPELRRPEHGVLRERVKEVRERMERIAG